MPIDRKPIITRHDPIVKTWDPASFLSVGNGDFAATVDCTGLQTIRPADEAATPLATMASWGMHDYPGAVPRRYDLLQRKTYQSARGVVGYMSDPTGQEELFERLRINPHRFNLARIALYERESASTPSVDSLSAIAQRLDLYTGMIESTYRHRGVPVTVHTVAHPLQDQLSVHLRSSALKASTLAISLSFPYPSHHKSGSNWDAPAAHRSLLTESGERTYAIARTIDDMRYTVVIQLDAKAHLEQRGDHEFVITTTEESLEANLLFVRPGREGEVTDFARCQEASRVHWEDFWQQGAFVDFAGSTDKRADELERRIILSRYLLAIQSGGSLPPAETGLTCNSWYGKFHLEMHLLHGAHFPLWGQSERLERSLSWYLEILPSARKRAREQGYRGARWPKMSEPEGSDAPSSIGCLLCWQQPHPILYGALLKRCKPDSPILASWQTIVEETATFMVDYLDWNEEMGAWTLGPPVIPVQENHDPNDVLNPTFELSYWRWALAMAIEMMGGYGSAVDPAWEAALAKLAPLPTDGEVYLAHQHCPDTYTAYAADHPSLLFASTIFDAGDVDLSTMRNSLNRVIECWDLNELWGWDFPLMAMCAARLGEADLAMDLLLMDSPKNTYTPNGHNAQLPKADLPLYLPGNGALLLAVALLLGGWDGKGDDTPTLPTKGWQAKVEGLHRLW
ncbi:MAG: hypothetical protein M0Q37_07680 [Sphaerochaeta sp.]|nr:hypothetical protein [Sphaerochaeta sp.]